MAVPTPLQRRGMRLAILAQTGGMLFTIVAKFGLLLLYLQALGVPPSRILVWLSIPWLGFFLAIPLAPWVDCHGRKRLGTIGQYLALVGLALLPMAGFAAGSAWAEVLIGAGIVLHTLGNASLAAGWFVLLMPLVPEDRRARFFGSLRLAWQAVGLVFTALAAAWLGSAPSVAAYQAVFTVVLAGAVTRLACYRFIPELEAPSGHREPLLAGLLTVLRHPGYLPFTTYMFLISLCMMPVPALFGLVEKEGLGYGDDTVVVLGNLWMLGAMAGMWLGGQVVDRLGSRLVFLSCHLAIAVILAAFVWRGSLPWPIFPTLATAHFTFGIAYAAVGVAFTTELLALTPATSRSLATSLGAALHLGGGSLAGLAAAWLLGLGMFSESWTLSGATVTAYDALLLLAMIGVVLLVVCLGQVPGMLRRHQHLPQA